MVQHGFRPQNLTDQEHMSLALQAEDAEKTAEKPTASDTKEGTEG